MKVRIMRYKHRILSSEFIFQNYIWQFWLLWILSSHLTILKCEKKVIVTFYVTIQIFFLTIVILYLTIQNLVYFAQ